jgi:hypothetical protein
MGRMRVKTGTATFFGAFPKKAGCPRFSGPMAASGYELALTYASGFLHKH